jgi:hypothetical protein
VRTSHMPPWHTPMQHRMSDLSLHWQMVLDCDSSSAGGGWWLLFVWARAGRAPQPHPFVRRERKLGVPAEKAPHKF